MPRKEYKPHGYQTIIAGHQLDHPRNAVWSFMGSGKTVSTLTSLAGLKAVGDIAPTLVLAPKRVAQSTWPDEALKWEHLRDLSVVPIVGDEVSRRRALAQYADIYTTNYEQLPWLVEHFGERWPFKRVVADESTRLKNFHGYDRKRKDGEVTHCLVGGTRSKALARVAHSKITEMWELTGTPAPNGLLDLWGQAWFIDAGKRLGSSVGAFKRRWFQKSYDGFGSTPLPFAQEQIQDALRDICLSLEAKDWFDVDEPITVPVYVDLPSRVRRLYDDMEKEFFMEWDGRECEAFNAAARTQKLLQIANGAVYVDPLAEDDSDKRSKEWREVHDLKVQALESIYNEANGMPLLVAYEFRSDLARILKAFPKAEVIDDDPDTITRWNAGKIPILLCHPASAGHGLNLQDGGNILVYFSHDWNLELRQQIAERIGPVRQKQSGYDRPCFVYNIIARDTMDEVVIARCESKREVQDILIDAMKRRYG